MEQVEVKSPEVNQEIVQAEASLESALATIKSNLNEPQKRETLKLNPESKEEVSEPEEEVVDTRSKFVETDEPAVQKRINELYRESKTANERNALLQDELRRIVDATEQREQELQNRLSQIEGRHVKNEEEVALTGLRQQYQEAISNFDYDRASQINEKIVDFKTEQKLNAVLNQQRQQTPRQERPVYSDSNPVDVAELNLLTSETDNNGQPTRPWLQGNHPKFQEVVNATAIIADRYLKKGQRPALSKVISEVERTLGLRNAQGLPQENSPLKHPPVLSSNTALAAPSDNQANKLTDEQRLYASRLGVSDTDYAKVLKLSKRGPVSVDSFKK